MPWNKGLTKYNSESVLKMSRTFKEKNIDNFKNWRENMRVLGNFPSQDSELKKTGALAELIGVVLGDGNISKFPRTERMIITGNSNNLGFINRYAYIVETVFNKKPVISKIKGENAIRISLYQRFISKRLGVPLGDRSGIIYEIPEWIIMNKLFLVSFLKGLFEAEGSLSIHLRTSTYNFQFCNYNKSLLEAVRISLIMLGYHPEVRKIYIRLRKKHEVESFKKLIEFRSYSDNAG